MQVFYTFWYFFAFLPGNAGWRRSLRPRSRKGAAWAVVFLPPFLLPTWAPRYLGRWQTRNMETVQMRITELDKLLFDSWALVDGDATLRVTSFRKLSLLQMAKLRKERTMKGRRLVTLTLGGESLTLT